MLSILSSLAENESISISENNKWAIQRRFKDGTYKLSYPPYGYDYVDGNIVVNEKQAEVVKRIFTDALAGKGAERIAQELNDEGVPTKKGGQWRANTIRGILRNEKYTGDLLMQKTYTDETFTRRRNKGELDQYFIENHHKAIISHADFEAANDAIKQRGKEKGIKKGSSKYLNRYPFSSKIICSECGSTFKRRIHSPKTNEYIAWCCSKHISKMEDCSMIYIREDRIHEAFVLMMNKLIFSQKVVLKPLLKSLKSTDHAVSLDQAQEIESKIEEKAEQLKVLVNLMTKGYLEPALFNTQKNELLVEAQKLKEKKDTLYRSINGEVNRVVELEQLIKYVSKSDAVLGFDDDLFEQFVTRVLAFSPTEIGFQLKCGLTLRERMER